MSQMPSRRKQLPPRQQTMECSDEIQQAFLPSTSPTAAQVSPQARHLGGLSSIKQLIVDCASHLFGSSRSRKMGGTAQQQTSTLFSDTFAAEGQAATALEARQKVRQLESHLAERQAHLQQLVDAHEGMKRDREAETCRYMGQVRALQDQLKTVNVECGQKSMTITALAEQLGREEQDHKATQAQLCHKEVECEELLEELGVKSRALSKAERELKKLQASAAVVASGATATGAASTSSNGGRSSEAGFSSEEQRQVLGALGLQVDQLVQRIRTLVLERKPWRAIITKYLDLQGSALPDANTLNYLLHDTLLRTLLNIQHPTIADMTPSPAPFCQFTSLPEAAGAAAAGDRYWRQAQARAWFLVTLALARGALQPNTGEDCAEVNRRVVAAVNAMVTEYLQLKQPLVKDVRGLLFTATLSAHAALLLPRCLHIHYPRAELVVPKRGSPVVEDSMEVVSELPGPNRCVAYVLQPGLHQPPPDHHHGSGGEEVLVKAKVVAYAPAGPHTPVGPHLPSTPQKPSSSVSSGPAPAPPGPSPPQSPPTPAAPSAWQRPLKHLSKQQPSTTAASSSHVPPIEMDEEPEIVSC